MAKWIDFEEIGESPSGRTTIWQVNSKDELCLGEIRWLATWRCYGFVPCSGMMFEKTCLRDIADFCEARMQERRAARAEDAHE